MSEIRRLPSEVEEFLKRDGPQTLLLRGEPGSGKTSLSLELLHEFDGKRIYVTARVPSAKVTRDFHWLVGPDPIDWRVIDLTERPGSLDEAAHTLVRAHELLTETDDSEVMKALWLPGAIQEAWGDTKADAPALIVVDPWNAFVDYYTESAGRAGATPPTLREIERTLLNMIARTKIHLVFVMEGHEASHLDYLADGVLVTSREKSGPFTERWLNLSKLRGVAIDRPMYPFTLEGGQFRCITPLAAVDGLSPTGPERDPTPHDPRLWPGNPDFARHFGRFGDGAFTLIELAPEVPREVPRVLLFPVMAQALNGGGRVLLIPPPTLAPEDSYLELRSVVAAGTLRDRFRVMSAFPSPLLSGGSDSILVPPNRVSWTKDGITVPVPEDPSFRVANPAAHGMNLMVVYFSGLEGLAQSGGVTLTREAIAGACRFTFGGEPTHMVAIGRTGDAYFASVAPITQLHLRVESRYGRILMHGTRPFTEEFALTQAAPTSPYRLLRIN
jgi:KaiC/GvpD/RAD55 family RecA-like ATPase